jgi:hypothetical protein
MIQPPASITLRCDSCRQPYAAGGDADPDAPPQCPACRRDVAEWALRDLLAASEALRNGAAPFDVLSGEQRLATLAELTDGAAPCDGCPMLAMMARENSRRDLADLRIGDRSE